MECAAASSCPQGPNCTDILAAGESGAPWAAGERADSAAALPEAARGGRSNREVSCETSAGSSAAPGSGFSQQAPALVWHGRLAAVELGRVRWESWMRKGQKRQRIREGSGTSAQVGVKEASSLQG